MKIQNAYKGFMVNLSKLMGGNENFMFNTEELFQFEKKIAEVSQFRNLFTKYARIDSIEEVIFFIIIFL